MDYEIMENKVKAFVLQKIEDAENYADSVSEVLNYRAIAFGALYFAANELFPCYNNDLAFWWERKTRFEFQKIIDKIEKKNKMTKKQIKVKNNRNRVWVSFNTGTRTHKNEKISNKRNRKNKF